METIWQLFLAHRKLLGLILGYVGVFIATLIYLQKTHKRLVFMKFFSDVFLVDALLLNRRVYRWLNLHYIYLSQFSFYE